MILLLTISFADFYCLYSWKRSTGAWNVSQSMHFWFFFLQEWKVCKESYCWIEIIFSIEDCIVLLSISIAHTKRVKSIIRNHTDSTTWKVSVFGVILVRIFLHLDWIQRDTLYPSVFSANAGKPWPEYFQIRALFTRCSLYLDINLVTILPVYNAK